MSSKINNPTLDKLFERTDLTEEFFANTGK